MTFAALQPLLNKFGFHIDGFALIFLSLIGSLTLLNLLYRTFASRKKQPNKSFELSKFKIVAPLIFGAPFLLASDLRIAAGCFFGITCTKILTAGSKRSSTDLIPWLIFVFACLQGNAILHNLNFQQPIAASLDLQKMGTIFLICLIFSVVSTTKAFIFNDLPNSAHRALQGITFLTLDSYVVLRLFNTNALTGPQLVVALVACIIAIIYLSTRSSGKLSLTTTISNCLSNLSIFLKKIIEDKVIEPVYFLLEFLGPLTGGLMSMKMTGKMNRSILLVTLTLLGSLFWGLLH